MRRFQIPFVAFVIFSVALSSPRSGFAIEDLAVGSTLVVTQDTKLRASPPKHKFLFFITEPGEENTVLKAGEKVRVDAVEQLKVPLGVHVWLKVRSDTGQSGWVFYGNDGNSNNL